MHHPLSVKTTLTTATFQGDTPFPDNVYGDDIPVEIVNHDAMDGNPACITVKIGDMMFQPRDFEYILKCVKKYKASIKAFNKA